MEVGRGTATETGTGSGEGTEEGSGEAALTTVGIVDSVSLPLMLLLMVK